MEDVHSQFTITGMWGAMTPLGKGVIIVLALMSIWSLTIAIERLVRDALDDAGYDEVGIERVLFPPWTTAWITDRGRQRLHDYGIAPPSESAVAECPQCGSTDTVEVSRFGSTPCKAQWRCKSCLEPFDRFKCH